MATRSRSHFVIARGGDAVMPCRRLRPCPGSSSGEGCCREQDSGCDDYGQGGAEPLHEATSGVVIVAWQMTATTESIGWPLA